MRWFVFAAMLAACGSTPELVVGKPGPDGWPELSNTVRCAVEKAIMSEPLDSLRAAKVKPDVLAKIEAMRARDEALMSATLADAAGQETIALLAKRAAKDPSRNCGRVNVQLLAFNDFHGQLEEPSGKSGEIITGFEDGKPVTVPAGGVEYFATWLAKLAAQEPNTLIVAAGDNIGATPLLSAAFHDEPTIEALNAAGLQITSVGNHEFDEGIDELTRMQKGGCHPKDGCFGGDGFGGAKFEYLAANVVRDSDGTTLFPGVTVRRFGRAQVAFIGLTLEATPTVVTSFGVQGVHFRDEAETVNEQALKLRAQGVKTIIVLLHEGGFNRGSYDGCDGISGPVFDVVAKFDPEIDVVVTGHTNAAHICVLDNRLVTSAAHAGRLVTDIDLVIDEASDGVIEKHAKNVIVTRDVEKAPALVEIVEHYRSLVKAYADVVVGTVPKDLTRAPDNAGQSALGAVIADAQLAASGTGADGQKADVALMNSGGVRADILAGEVTYGEAFAVQPFVNALVTMTYSGAELEAILEEQFRSTEATKGIPKVLQVSASLRYTFDLSRPEGDRVDTKSIRVNGKALDPKKDYRVVMNAFLAGAGDGFASIAKGRDRQVGMVDLDALVAYLKSHPQLVAPPGGRVTRKGP